MRSNEFAKRRNERSRKLGSAVGTTVVFLLCLSGANKVLAQTFHNGTTPAAFAPGAPAGSYPLSGVENINLFNGNLNFTLPLSKIGGRGDSQSAIVLPIEFQWTNWYFWQNPFDGTYYNPLPQYNWIQTVHPGYGPGVLFLRAENMKISECGIYEIRQSRTRLTFVAQDGTEIELRDTIHGGAPVWYGSCSSGGPVPSRGTTFVTADGSAATFISDTPISDSGTNVGYMSFTNGDISGVLKMRDGTHYRIDHGLVSWTRDRNGNKTTYTYAYNRVTLIKDSLGRETTIEYGINDVAPYGLCDRITFKGTGGQTRIVRISYAALSSVLVSGFWIQTKNQLFPHPSPDFVNTGMMSSPFNPSVISSVWLPDDGSTTRRYRFFYNSYGELARAELPTGGAYEYDWENGQPLGWFGCNGYFQEGEIIRRVKERRVKNGTTVEHKTTYTYTGPSCNQSANSMVTVDYFDGTMVGFPRISREKHYFYGTVAEPPYLAHLFNESRWTHGKEYRTEIFGSDGTTLLRKVEHTWQQRASVSWWNCIQHCTQTNAPPNDPRIVETITTLADSNQVSKVTFGFDQFNNRTDVWEYDFGAGAPGPFLRRHHTDFVTGTSYISSTGSHLRELPLQMWTSSDSGGSTKASLTQFEYDNYSTDSSHAGLLSRANVVGHDSINYGTSFAHRGNLTAVTTYANASGQAGSVSIYSQYDILGNVVKTIDANGNAHTISYSDNFGVPDAEATTNSAPAHLGGLNTFAFATSAVNALNWTSYLQYDYFTGAPVNVQDANGGVSKTAYSDVLDRPTQTVSAIGSSLERQTSILYDDANRKVETTSDLSTLNDNLLKNVSFYDSFGRTNEKRDYEAGGDYSATQIQYDCYGRASKRSNPFRPTEIDVSHPLQWTTTKFDSLGRITEVETPDGAKVSTSYSGNKTLVTDPAGKQRISKSDALGQVKEVWEITTQDAETEGVTFPNTSIAYGYKTGYSYDVLGNLTSVNQGLQTRTFIYDGLSRLVSAANPESGNITYIYDSAGNLTQKTDARSIITVYTYDPLNRVTQRDYSDSTPDVLYSYGTTAPTIGRLTKVESSLSKTEYTGFDSLGRVTGHKQTTDGQAYITAYSYYLNGALMEETYPSGRKIRNMLDASGDLSQVETQPAGGSWQIRANNFSYTAAGAVSSMEMGNGQWESVMFNSRLQPTQVALGTTASLTDLLKLEYSYGTTSNNGNVLTQTITVPGLANPFVQTYAYDALNRLASATETNNSTQSWTQVYSYDRYGNRNVTSGAGQTNLTYGSTNNRITTGGYSYDASGNTLAVSSGKSYVYDAENKQASVSNGSGPVGTYYYDGDGKRIKKASSGDSMIFVYNAAGKLVEEYLTSSPTTVTTTYVYAGSRLLTTETASGTNYLTSDPLGSPRINTNAAGSVIARHDYYPFGEEISTSQRTSGLGYAGDVLRKQFTGYERDDESELDFAQARYYSSMIGRFTSPDNFLNDTVRTDPRSWNLYTYVRNNPLRYVDPTGEKIYVYLDELDENGKRIRLEYRAGRLFTSNGKEYTGNNAYAKKVLNYLNTLSADKTLGRMIADLVASRKEHVIQRDLVKTDRNETVPTANGTDVFWSGEDTKATGPSGIPKVGDGEPSKAIYTLTHELLGHTWRIDRGIERTDSVEAGIILKKGKIYSHVPIPRREIDAVNIENRARILLGDQIRRTYMGESIDDFLDPPSRDPNAKPPTLRLTPRPRQ